MIKLKMTEPVAPGDTVSYSYNGHVNFATVLSVHPLSNRHWSINAIPIHRQIDIPQ